MSLGIADLSLYQHLSIISNELKPKYQVRYQVRVRTLSKFLLINFKTKTQTTANTYYSPKGTSSVVYKQF